MKRLGAFAGISIVAIGFFWFGAHPAAAAREERDTRTQRVVVRSTTPAEQQMEEALQKIQEIKAELQNEVNVLREQRRAALEEVGVLPQDLPEGEEGTLIDLTRSDAVTDSGYQERVVITVVEIIELVKTIPEEIEARDKAVREAHAYRESHQATSTSVRVSSGTIVREHGRTVSISTFATSSSPTMGEEKPASQSTSAYPAGNSQTATTTASTSTPVGTGSTKPISATGSTSGGSPSAATTPRGFVTISFDDGWKDAYQKASPVLNAAGYEATWFIVSGYLGWPAFVSEEEVQSLAAQGHEIGSHSATHTDPHKISKEEHIIELTISKRDLEALGVGPIRALAYPYGHYSDSIIDDARTAGYSSGRSASDELTINTSTTDPYAILSFSPIQTTSFEEMKDFVDDAVTRGGWAVISFHRVGNPDEYYSVSEEFFRQFIDYLKEQHIDVVTISEGAERLLSGS
jgi:peptidoglycan/xylan/chitin deacetylase (PgdA/CDA1 family)